MMIESVNQLGRVKYTNEQTDAWMEAIPTVERMESLMNEPDRIGWVAVVDDVDFQDITLLISIELPIVVVAPRRRRPK